MSLSADIEDLARTITIAEVVEELGGTRDAAGELGVSQREVQRWLKGERGEAGQVRTPKRNARFQTARLEMAYSRLGASGVVISEADVYMQISEDPRGERDIHAEVALSGEQFQPVLEALREGDEAGAVQAFKAPFLSGYGINPDAVSTWDWATGQLDFA